MTELKPTSIPAWRDFPLILLVSSATSRGAFARFLSVIYGSLVGECSHLGVTQVQALGSHLALLAWQEIFLEETAMSKKRSRRTASPDG